MYIDKKEVLRYLRCRGTPDEAVSRLTDECIALCGNTAKPLYTCSYFDIAPAEGGIAVCGTDIVLTGNSIKKHLDGCTRCVITAATLGAAADNLIRTTESRDMAKAVILDACFTACIEELCDIISRDTEERAARQGFSSTRRFSPGYGDLPLALQRSILAALGAQKRIGLTLTPTDIMIPRKSVTAIIGLRPRQG